jgi:PAS domain S-box-containing protein/putative nucleotidyltransferase with HDIG domain
MPPAGEEEALDRAAKRVLQQPLAEDVLGALIHGEIDALLVSNGQGPQVLTLQGAEHPYRVILESIGEGACTFGEGGTILYANTRLADMLDVPVERLIGSRVGEWLCAEDGGPFWALVAANGGGSAETSLKTSSGLVPVMAAIRDLRIDEQRAHFMVVTDITDRAAMEGELRESEERYRALFERSFECVYLHDFEGRFLDANRAALDLLGYGPEEICSTTFAALLDEAELPKAQAALARLRETGQQEGVVEYKLRRKDGAFVYVEAQASVVRRHGEAYAIQGIARDVTARRAAEEKLALSERRFRQLFQHSTQAVALHEIILDEAGRAVDYRFLAANPAFSRHTGFVVEEILGRTVREVVPGIEDSGLIALYGEVVESGEPLEITTFVKALDRHYEISAFRVGPHQFAAAFVDVSAREQAQRALQESVATTKSALRETVAALGATTEMRDPYTAGHQRRVAELADAVAAELAWGEEKRDTLHTAALLHDIGKIVVPAEILSKPGRLSNTEMEIIRGHAAAGGDLVAHIQFEGAVADVVRQHHERLDGSGYPDGLRDGQILPEARVLAVADVVEAMMSHRPYRAALAPEVALEEIEDGSGVRYDADVVAACLVLFRERDFRFSD